ncbi:hypothetical protein A3J17_00710 [Candidatus Curtissbacteria bacterium RIFCSPLOWO2_02_FULL_40_11]|uniref:DUF2283 domain-containing protein n=1 Tax=Candidatus Curtissbacteria bacterium RIFCSPHIGHO2_02_FULL_40_16b TaxID=1797714 RepID=A0A1F5G9P2_9BACT|nr:MAG: hypothetical protein A3D04_05170 [Candidatus Curtissbacteria bacterium RIFCSPHIGHO2_02_FULL_40_16b]OGD99308.1 MAG: hypothetical protein A3J17_00710 [Candidatus Curtissbacteria bacterium RIFCSPLOWO2_02_FULL_40_11]
MKISYDPKIDAMYICFKSGKYDRTKKITDDILVDVTKKGDVLGLEILDAKKQFGDIKQAKIEFSPKPSYQSA